MTHDAARRFILKAVARARRTAVVRSSTRPRSVFSYLAGRVLHSAVRSPDQLGQSSGRPGQSSASAQRSSISSRWRRLPMRTKRLTVGDPQGRSQLRVRRAAAPGRGQRPRHQAPWLRVRPGRQPHRDAARRQARRAGELRCGRPAHHASPARTGSSRPASRTTPTATWSSAARAMSARRPAWLSTTKGEAWKLWFTASR